LIIRDLILIKWVIGWIVGSCVVLCDADGAPPPPDEEGLDRWQPPNIFSARLIGKLTHQLVVVLDSLYYSS